MTTSLRTLFVASAVLVSACAHVPRAPDPTDEQIAMRATYVAEHPEGHFNERIQRGEIDRGMSAYEVLASWGVPDGRRIDRDRPDEEAWFYLERDEFSQDYIIYEVVFNQRTLAKWYMTRGTVGSGGVFNSGAAGYAVYRESRVNAPAPGPDIGTGPLKK
jgi:hypothetical protein